MNEITKCGPASDRRIGGLRDESPVLEVSGLHRPGLEPTSFVLRRGECIVVRGPSGAGKTLLLRSIADLDANDGEVCLNGRRRESVSAPEWRRQVGYLPAEPAWWADTVGAHYADWGAAAPLVQRLGLPVEAATWDLTRPSTGERLRLALVRALLIGPQVLLLDEPTAALDPVAVALVEALIREQMARGLSVLWVTHDESQADRMATRLLIVKQGSVREEVES